VKNNELNTLQNTKKQPNRQTKTEKKYNKNRKKTPTNNPKTRQTTRQKLGKNGKNAYLEEEKGTKPRGEWTTIIKTEKMENNTPQTHNQNTENQERQNWEDQRQAQWKIDEAEGKDWRNPAYDELEQDTDW
jgi:hypothetical protein